MPLPYVGAGLAIGVGRESTWGVAVSRTHWYRGVSSTLARTVTTVRRPHLHRGSSSRNARESYVSSDTVTGQIEIELAYEGCGPILQEILHGTPSTGSPSGGLYPHTFLLAANPPTGGLTIEVIHGNGDAEVFEGCRVTKATARLTPGDVLRVVLDIIGETSGGLTTAGSATFSSNDVPILHDQIGQLAFNSQNYDLRSLELVVDNKFASRPHLGSKLTKEPVPGTIEIKLTVEVDWLNNNLYTAYLASTQADVTFTFTGTGSRSAAFTLHNCIAETYSKPINTPDVLRQKVTFAAFRDATDQGLALVLTNTQATALAA